MLKVKYYKDLNHNYLIIITKLAEEEQNYQHRMLTDNRIKNFLSCKIRYIDEECHFYYEISSKQNLESLFEKKEMGYKQIRRLFECIKEAADELDNFLLDSRCILLHPKYIYIKPESEEYFFLYYPYYMEEREENMTSMSLSEFLISRMNHEQEETAAVVYKIYELIQDDKFILSEVLDLFSSDIGYDHREEIKEAEPVQERDNYFKEENPQFLEEQNNYYEERKKYANGAAVMAVLSFICLSAAAGIFCITYFYSLTVEEKVISMAGIIMLIILSAVFLLLFIFRLSGYRKTGYEDKKYEEKEEEEIEAFQGETNKYSPILQTAERGRESEDYGNTVFLDDAICKMENKLYGINKGNKYHIDLQHLPCTVGKMAGSVDTVIKDSTISRIHARLTKQEDGIYLTDLNSTNGTFKNGLRLEPNDTVLIEPGDELRFGRMAFSYR